MTRRIAIGARSREIAHLLGSSIFVLFLLISDYASADFFIGRDSNVLILSGYSSELTKRELPTLNDRLNFLLQGLSEGLDEMFNANVELLSERDLNALLELRRLRKEEPADIKKFLQIRKYTHLVVADVEMKGESTGSAWLQIAALSHDGSTTESATTRKIPLKATQSDSDLNERRKDLLRDFAKFRSPDAPKRVTVFCILPRNNLVFDKPTNPQKLERDLSGRITMQIIDIHNSQKMQEMGYIPIVNRQSWEFKLVDDGRKITCDSPRDSGVISVATRLADYAINGDVAVIVAPTRQHQIDLTIRITRELPTTCKAQPILIPHPFHRSSYEGNAKDELLSEFSERILPTEYEQKWLAVLETCK